jgi:hypothetical protein
MDLQQLRVVRLADAEALAEAPNADVAAMAAAEETQSHVSGTTGPLHSGRSTLAIDPAPMCV